MNATAVESLALPRRSPVHLASCRQIQPNRAVVRALRI